MFSRELEIKKSSGAFILKGMFYLLMLLLSVFCCLSTWIFYINEKYTTYITAIGFISTLYFTYLFAYTIYRGIRPKNALILTEKGIYDFINDPGKGIFINWENIASVKVFGSDKAPLLGIELYDSDILVESLRKNIGEEIRSNIQAGLPAIVIRQSDIAPSLPQVLPAFNEFISLTRPIPTVQNPQTANNPLTAATTMNTIPTARNTPSEKITIAPMSPKISDETTDDSILVVEDERKPAADPAVPQFAKDIDEIFIIPPEPVVIEPEEVGKKQEAEDVLTFMDPPSRKSEKPSLGDFRFDSAPLFGSKPAKKTNDINFARTKEIPAVKAEPVATKQQTSETVKEEPQPAQKKEIKTLEELLSQFSVPTNKDKKE